MKYIFCILPLLIFNSCSNSVDDIQTSKYSASDLVPLNDSTKNLYYIDAACIEFVIEGQDSFKRENQVELSKDSISSYYSDLLYIYNNSYRLSNSFFECAKSLHTYSISNLFQFHVNVDTNKPWLSNWKKGITYTGVKEIDKLFSIYHLSVAPGSENGGAVGFTINSPEPINTLALLEKFKSTSEFGYLDAGGFYGGYSYILLKSEDNSRYYLFYNGVNNSSSKYSEYQYWIVKIRQPYLVISEEGTLTPPPNY